MSAITLHLSDYLEPDERFHFARTRLVPGAKAREHRHDFFEMFWVERGRVAHRAFDNEEPLAEGALCFIRPETVHSLRPRDGAATITNIAFWPETVVHLQSRYGETLAQVGAWSEDRSTSHDLNGADHRKLTALAGQLEQAGRSQFALDAFLLSAFSLLTHPDPLPDGADQGPVWLTESCRALRQTDVLRAGVAGFVAVSGLNPSHVSRVCVRHTGKTPSQLVAAARMAMAARLLATTDEPIIAIAMEVGLDNLSHFYALFKRYHATTPRAYRVQHRRSIVGV
ncbi:MAG: helix-turn-helix domain-containing protein [Rhizobiales bacterium]|nr:helix-turn-helix domain-containing protein [Hyphomicrobiales bacterium]MBO6697371.1 helix-turn-helix domain-containing protein [Hyphomicrobiales bacterium]MBO6736374.1 helix-turn-helix domain-containing protein [Hyphomicrobiales bacterium]MBO6912844.1 helix-turn-helix domain-containing protein [Hyphomicrobiales bacterium]MBO6954012.1 helix-turn-helix domain-containing protein [Hyphomicrobiales bacterium]